MRKKLVILSLVLAAPLFMGCSDDSTGTPDKDQGAPDQAVTDKGPTGDMPVGDTTAKKKVEEYVPADNELAGWVEDTTAGPAGVEAAYNDTAIEAIINGHHQPYAKEGCAGFAKQEYMKGNGTIALEIWEMNTAAGAKNMYDLNKTTGENDDGWTFDTIADVVDGGIIIDTYDAGWRAYAYKGAYILMIQAATTEATEQTALRTDVEAFIKLLTGKLPK